MIWEICKKRLCTEKDFSKRWYNNDREPSEDKPPNCSAAAHSSLPL